RRTRMQGWWSRNRLYVFTVFVACICILSNLMGAATAVLVLPTLQWVDINQAQNLWFGEPNSSQTPLDLTIVPTCNKTNLAAGNYSCTGNLYSASSDVIVGAAVSTDDQIFNLNTGDAIQHALLLPPVLQEGNMSFTVNISDSSIWVPIRQTLRKISVDLEDYETATTTGRSIMPDYP